MCGIIGYAGHDNAIPYLLEGIKNLEYRGYDSFGIGFIQDGKIVIKKDVESIENVISKYNISDYVSNIGIAHTRWATHGRIEQRNAHPISDCKNDIAVVHNGTIENFEDMKLALKAHTFVSDTDTEVIAHAVEEELQNHNTLFDSVYHIFHKIKGASSFAVLSSKDNKIIAAKNGTPLVFGIGKNGYFVASDIPSFLKYTNKVIYLTDGDIVMFDKEHYEIKNALNKEIKHTINIVTFNVKEADKGKFDHFMEKEIYDEFELWSKFESYDTSNLKEAITLINDARKVYITGAGTSFYASVAGAMLLRDNGIDAYAIAPYEIENFAKIIKKEDLFIIVSQSGETYDIINELPIIKENKKIGIINVEGSTLSRAVDLYINMECGTEKAVAATKSMMSTLMIFKILSCLIADTDYIKDLKLLNLEKFNVLVPSIQKLLDDLASKLAVEESIYFTGRDYSYIIALEGALKMKEISYIHAEAINLASIKHGPLALIEKGTKVITLINPDTEQLALNNIEELKARGAYIIGIYQRPLKQFDMFIRTVNAGIFSFAPELLIVQLLAYKVAVKKGFNPDKPRNLAKSVTVK
ncbi:MAG: glutamine--fructose-6-phosphate transaminase (isomerizing) [Candidatus Micrarchaeia archaeon]